MHTMDTRAVLAALALLAAPGCLLGQEEPEMGWRGNADFGLTVTQGNSETTNLAITGHSVYRVERQRITLDANFIRASAEGVRTANKAEGRARYDFFPNERFFVFARTGIGFDEPAGIDLRVSPGAGVGYTVLRGDAATLDTQVEGRWIRDSFEDGTTDQDLFVTASENFAWQITETADLAQLFEYSPNSADLSDFLLNGEVALSVLITSGLGLKVSVRDEYNSEPFVDAGTGVARKKNDLTFVTGLTVQF